MEGELWRTRRSMAERFRLIISLRRGHRAMPMGAGENNAMPRAERPPRNRMRKDGSAISKARVSTHTSSQAARTTPTVKLPRLVPHFREDLFEARGALMKRVQEQ